MTDIREFVASKGILLRYEALNPGLRGSTFMKGSKRFIIVNKFDPKERQNFTIAHEYCEILLDTNTEMSLDEKHVQANRMAAELLLPDERFGTLVHSENILSLKEHFPSVSYEVIARRIPHFIPSVVTIFDNGQCTSRFGSDEINFPSLPTSQELETLDHCVSTKEIAKIENPPLFIEAIPLEEKNCVLRVIVVTKIDGEIFE